MAWLADADKRAERAVARWNKEIEQRDRESAEHFRFQTKSRIYGEKEREALLDEVMYTMKQAVKWRAAGLLDQPSDIPVGRYRGFDIKVYTRRDEIQFALSGIDSYEPENLRYRVEEKFSLNGFINRLDNFMARFEDWRQKAEEAREEEWREYEKAKTEQSKPFSQKERLEALRQDVRDVMTELKLVQADDNYVSQWQPKSMANDGGGQQEKTRMRM